MQECQPSQVLFDYLQQELQQDQIARVEAHLPHCAACRDELHRLQQQIRKVQDTLAQLDPGPGRPAEPQPDLSRLPVLPISVLPVSRLAVGFTVAVLLILCGVMHPAGKQSALADSISQLKVIMEITAILNRAASMDCSVLKSGTGSDSYHVRWNESGITRVDRESSDGMKQTLWIADTTEPPDPVWQPAMEFLTPAILARHMEGAYGLMQSVRHDADGSDRFLLVGRENQQVIEIAVDERTYLPKTLKKYLPDSKAGEARKNVLEVRFLWNRPVPKKLLIPRPAAGK